MEVFLNAPATSRTRYMKAFGFARLAWLPVPEFFVFHGDVAAWFAQLGVMRIKILVAFFHDIQLRVEKFWKVLEAVDSAVFTTQIVTRSRAPFLRELAVDDDGVFNTHSTVWHGEKKLVDLLWRADIDCVLNVPSFELVVVAAV